MEMDEKKRAEERREKREERERRSRVEEEVEVTGRWDATTLRLTGHWPILHGVYYRQIHIQQPALRPKHNTLYLFIYQQDYVRRRQSPSLIQGQSQFQWRHPWFHPTDRVRRSTCSSRVFDTGYCIYHTLILLSALLCAFLYLLWMR